MHQNRRFEFQRLFFAASIGGALFFSFASFAQTAGRQMLRGHVPPAIARFHLQPLRNLPATNRLNLAISLPLRNEAELNKLLQEIYDPASTNYHHYLTPQQFTEQFGPTEQDYDAVINFAKTNGLTVAATYPNRTLVDVSGSAATVEKVFHVTLRVYRHPTENRNFFAPDTEPSIDLSIPILHVSGLDNFTIPRPAFIKKARLNNNPPGASPAAGSGSGPNGEYMGKDFRAAYAPGVTLDGSGQMVGLLELDGYYTNDIISYENQAGLPHLTLTNVLVDNYSGTAGGNNSEVALDIEMAISMATNLSKVVVYEKQNNGNVVDILSRIANYTNDFTTNNFPKQISSSWLLGDNSGYEAYYLQMQAQGQSFFQASGDDGAYYTANENTEQSADDPNITLVGGTTLFTTGPAGAYSSETVWNWYSSGLGTAAGGGGTNFNGIPIPSWQQGINMTTNQGSTKLRNVPDVALTADNIYVVYNNGNFNQNEYFGGTSCAAPLWAGFTALINQQAAARGASSVGFINPAVYAIGKSASYSSDFHDITTGNNTNSTVSNKYFAVPGYDLCTGWGTPNGQNLINALAPAPDTLIITPVVGFNASGPPGGAFSPNSQNYFLTNSSASSLAWSLVNTSSWLNASSAGGTLAVGGAANVTISLSAAANSFGVGNYNAIVTFTNKTSHVAQNLQYTLQVLEPLIITPSDGFTASGAVGGAFNSSAQNFSLSNAASVPLNWQAATPAWLDVSPTSGSLGGNAAVTVAASLNSAADNLAGGIYTSQISFTDQTSGVVQSRQFTLSVGQSAAQNGGFETGDFTDWTLNESSGVYSFVDNGSQSGISPHSGSYLAALGHPTTLGFLSQTVPTVANQSYLLSLWLNSPNVSQITHHKITSNTPNEFSVSWNGNTLFDQVNIGPIGWTNLQFIVTATNSSSALQFGERVDPWYFGLDDVNVWPIPAPTFRGISKNANNSIVFTWNSLTSIVYQVQYSTNLATTNWFILSTNSATGFTLTVTNSIGTNSQRFYRVRRLP